MADDGSTPQRIAHLIRSRRHDKGWTQEDLVSASGVSLPTIKRYESARSVNPEREVLRALFFALEIDMRELPVALGLVTREEMGLPPEQPRRFDHATEEILGLLADPRVSLTEKEALAGLLRARLGALRQRPTPERPGRRAG